MKNIKWTELLIFIIGTELVGALSSLLSGNFSSFYGELTKPPLAPPGILFPVVWTILYALMGISAYMIYVSDTDADTGEKKNALVLYAVQLFINFMWSIVFFRFEQIGTAAAILIVLVVLVIMMILTFMKIRPLAGYINIPYLIWILFAAYLNIGILILN
ncbi:MAG: tryptophan-rich sensory protein [Ruminococcus sp.]|nr:tryptophan-rich sensory protein [Ruminococcus sp.]